MATILTVDGQSFKGKFFGKDCGKQIIGELVFQTGNCGYVEALTDPSYAKQFLVLTYPLIGNYGVGRPESMESEKIWAAALIIGNLSEIGSHWDSQRTLSQWLYDQHVPIIHDVDTRALTKAIREKGTMLAEVIVGNEDGNVEKAVFVNIMEENLAAEVSCKKAWTFGDETKASYRILVLDNGMKRNQLRCLQARKCCGLVLPHNTENIIEIAQDYDGLFLSNGPGDPKMCSTAIEQLRAMIAQPREKQFPIFGICLGHQLLSLAAGAKTLKLKFGNRGHNLPVIHMDTGRCVMTAQNHGYAVEANTLNGQEWTELFHNANDHSNEGVVHSSLPIFSVQFHPEHAPGPTDMEWLFDIFTMAMKRSKSGDTINLREEIKKEFAFRSSSDYRVSIGKQSKILILGSGGLSIGQAGEFDYSGAQAIKALKDMGIKIVLVNANVATVQTTKGFADRVYFLPITEETITEIIEKERPTGILCTFGGQTALNCALALHKKGIFDTFKCRVLGTPMDAILRTEDRDMFRIELEKIGERVAPSKAATTLEEAEQAAEEIGYPVLVRAAFALGGLGSGFANTKAELREIVTQALAHSEQILIDKSVRGWKEIEYEVVRDAYDNCITVCNMENIDPVGIHTGESVVVAPSQTLNNEEYFGLRKTALRVIRHFGIVGECNIQYALNPEKFEYYIIEVNARLSRSSALASKATGYPLAFVAAKLALGASLAELKNMVTGGLSIACFEPSLDYCVVKVPRWDLNKFSRVSTKIGSSMKSVGEAMGIGRTFEEALQKALRMANDSHEGFSPDIFSRPVTKEDLEQPTDKRMFAIARFLRYGDENSGRGSSSRSNNANNGESEEDGWAHLQAEEELVAEEKNRAENGGNDGTSQPYMLNRLAETVHKVTGIDRWFLARMCSIISMYNRIEKSHQNILDLTLANRNQREMDNCVEMIKEAKQIGFSDAQIARLIGSTERNFREWRRLHGIVPFVKQIDTVAGEWPASTNYLYLTYNGQEHDVQFNGQQEKAVMVLGSGVYRIGSSVEFDACAVRCVQTLDKLGYKTIMINCNPETVSTDYDICNRLYFEEISLEVVSTIYELEMPLGAILAFGGQAANNIALALDSPSLTVPIKVFGTSPISIDEAEDRYKFSRQLDKLNISQPQWRNASSEEEAIDFCKHVGYPCLIRPSYVLSGAAMKVAHNERDLREYLKKAKFIAKDKPVVVSQFIEDAKEIDVDVVCIGGKVLEKAISEHVENAGVHSGDATLVTPPQDLTTATIAKISEIAHKIAHAFAVTGPFNLQLIAKNDNLFVIECNLRVSRSFPFVSKTLDYDFVELATKAMLFKGSPEQFLQTHVPPTKPTKIGVKVPQFSFSRLAGAEVLMGVEMLSTGEVGCFGRNRQEAYLKGLLSTGFQLPKRAIFLSIGGVYPKEEMLPHIKTLSELGYSLYGSKGTTDYYAHNGIEITQLDWPFDDATVWNGDGSEMFQQGKMSTVNATITEFVSKKNIDFMINLPIRKSGSYQISAYRTHGYKTRRMAIDNGIPLMTDIKCAKLFIQALKELRITPTNCQLPPINPQFDCLSNESLIRLPGLIDIHVHMREPGGEHKETWQTGTKAAVAGGITLVLAMPNTNPALIDMNSYNQINNLATKNAFCDFGLYMGATEENAALGSQFGQKCAGLKMYLNDTFSTLKMTKMGQWIEHMRQFPANRPIVCHAEGQTLAAVLFCAKNCQRAVHICHVSSAEEIELIKMAKQSGQQVTCEVCPHHLFLTQEMLAQGMREVRPRLAISKADCDALWENMEFIDCFATDHAPHTLEEKLAENAPPGFPGIEMMLPLLLQAVYEGKLKEKQLRDRLYTNPRKIFGLPEQPNTYIEVNINETWTIPKDGGWSKAGWTPFEGRQVRGRVKTVVIRGTTVFMDGQFLVEPGYGRNIRQMDDEGNVGNNGLGGRGDGGDGGDGAGGGSGGSHGDGGPNSHQLSRESQDFDFSSSNFSALQSSSNNINGTTINGPIGGVGNKNLWYGQHIIRVDQFDRAMLRQLFTLANQFEKDEQQTYYGLLRKTIGALAFFENSTRTMCSFNNAICKLEGKVCQLPPPEFSSTKKGETLEDTITTLCQLGNRFIVLRHGDIGACDRAIQAVQQSKGLHARQQQCLIVNAGDGAGEHPTQALLDLYTIRQKLSTINGKKIAMVGDLRYGRTVHSLAKILCLYGDITLHYVSPTENLGMPEEVKEYVANKSNIVQKEFTSLEEGIYNVDVIYMTRIQEERFGSKEAFEKVKGKFILTPKILRNAIANQLDEEHEFCATAGNKDRRRPSPIIMHPLPRVDEISRELDTDERAVYMDQMEYGIYVRMALLCLMLRPDL